MSYLEKKIADCDAEIKKCIAEGKMTPKPTKEKFFGMSRQKMVNLFI